MDDVISTAEASRLLGVGATALKRWSDAGLLPCIRTAGGHRRFRRSDVERFLATHAAGGGAGAGASAAAAADEITGWVDTLMAPTSSTELAAMLLRLRARTGSWHQAATTVGRVLDALGERWAAGRCTVLAEHQATDRLARALVRVSEEIPVRLEAPRALLATAPGEEHTMGLALVELCLREAGWATSWAGRATPAEEIVAAVRGGLVEMVVLSASRYYEDTHALARLCERVGAACRTARVPLIVGGWGAWPALPRAAQLLREFGDLHELAVELGSRQR
jgi:excisionase family DNA binding protein